MNFVPMDIYKPECTSPLLLVNRAAINMLFHGSKLFLHGRPSVFVNRDNINDYDKSKLLALANNMKEEQLNECYVERGTYREPLFIYVPCGKCELCRHRKYVDFIARCNMESQMYDCPPFFITLTYDNEHLPERGELRYKDVQDFFKRLRRRWDSCGLEHNIRYVVACEYGKLRHRPHYHVILWNNPYKASEMQPERVAKLSEDIFLAWSNCQPSGFDCRQAAGGAAGYAAKYISKPPLTYGHWTKPKIHTSIGHGGIGSGLIMSKLQHYRENPQKRVFSYIDKSTLQVVNQNFGQYITTHLWPSPTRLVPASVRQAYKEFCDLLHVAVSLSVIPLSVAVEYAELMRPYKNVLVNRISEKECKSLGKVGLCYIWHKARIARYLDLLANDILSEYVDELIDKEYIELYYKYKSFNVNTEREDTAGKLLLLRQKLEVDALKESL